MLESDVYKYLESNHIEYELIRHEAAYTIEEIEKMNIKGYEYVVKNLFVRDDKKRHYYLIVVKKDTVVNMKELQSKINSRRLSFASEEDLKKYLSLSHGEVTPLGIFNDVSQSVEVIFDQNISDIIGIHPLTNTKTIYIKTSELIQMIKEYGNKVSVVSL